MFTLLFLLFAVLAEAQIPKTMLALHKATILPCKTPFRCIKTHTIDTPSPGKGQVLVKVGGSSVNPCDVDYIEFDEGCNGGKGTLGMDLAGTIVAVGDAVSRLKVGDEVWADAGGVVGDTGAMAEYAVFSEEQTGLKPKSMNFTEAGTLPLVGLTSLECLQKTGAPWSNRTNVTVAITSGSGGTGFVAIQLAKNAFGAANVITAASGAGIDFVKSIGADVVIDYKKEEIFATLPDNSVDIVYDNYGAKGTADQAMRVIRPGGVYLILPGGNGGTVTPNPKPGVTQINFGLTTSSHYERLDLLAAWADAGKLQPHVFAHYALQNGAEAFALSKTGTVIGKVAVTP